MNPFVQYHSRYLGFRTALDVSQLLKHVEQDVAGLNNLFMAGLGMGTLFLRMGAVIQMSEKLHDEVTGNDVLFMKRVMDNLREILPSDTNWKNLWYISMTPESKWDNAIPRDSHKVSMLDRFVAFRNKYVHQSIRLIPEHLKDIEMGIQVLDDMASLFVLFKTGEIELKDERYFWRQDERTLELSPFVQEGAQEGLPYLFQGFYENNSKAKFINTVYGDETLPEANLKLEEKFESIEQALRGGAGKVFDFSERLKYYLDCFVGRELEVRSVLEWVNGDSLNNVMPIYSEAGMGKGALTARVIEGLTHDGIPVMYHYCGSGMANSLHAVLYHFILQGKKMPGMKGAGIWKVENESLQRKMDRLPSRYHDAIQLFQKLLDDCYNPSKSYKDKPLVIVIDGLDEASVANSQLKVSDWFYTYNDKDEPLEDWKSPGFVKWIFTYRSLSGSSKDGFRLDGRFLFEQNELVQPIKGLTEVAVREALKPFNVSEEYIQAVLDRGGDGMKVIDPTYLRFICDELISGKLDKSNLYALPIGVSSIFDKIFVFNDSIISRSVSLDMFTSMALLGEGASLEQISTLTARSIDDWNQFIQLYSRYFNVDNNGNYRLFHYRLIVFFLQRNNNHKIRINAQYILNNLDLITDKIWVNKNRGYFLFINKEVERLFIHISINREQKSKSWWIKDLDRLLDLLNDDVNPNDIDYTVLCELLRSCFDFSVQRKGVRIIVLNAGKIDWDALDSFFHTTRFQYELAIEFSKYPEKLPANWKEIFLNEDHACSYMFSYAWKYSQFNNSSQIDQALIKEVWKVGSPYNRIIIIMIWGYLKLNGHEYKWLDDLIELKSDWQYLVEEKENWVWSLEQKRESKYVLKFEAIKNVLENRYHYIFDNYWSLFDYTDELNQDTSTLWLSDQALEIALWIYRHPIWEVGKIANQIVVNRLRVKDLRSKTLDWLLANWESEEFYALGEVIFELRPYLSFEDYLALIRKLVTTSSCQLRGSFISDLILYLEGAVDEDFTKSLATEIIPIMISNASDIWEVQELFRLLKLLMEIYVLNKKQVIDFVNGIDLTRGIEDAYEFDYNEFWKLLEIKNGIVR